MGIYYDYLKVEICYWGLYFGDVKLRGGYILVWRIELVFVVLNLEVREILENVVELLVDIVCGEVLLIMYIKIIGDVDF